MTVLILSLVFIGFICSQFLLALNFFTFVPFGYFSTVVFVVGFFIYIHLFFNMGRLSFSRGALPVLLFYIFFVVVFLVKIFYVVIDGVIDHAFRSHLVFLIFYFMMPVVAYMMFSSNSGRSLVFVFLLLLLFVILFVMKNGDIRSYTIDYDGRLFQLNYQAIGAAVVVLYVFLIDYKNSYASFAVWLVALGCCYFIGARSEVIALLLIFMLDSIVKRRGLLSFVCAHIAIISIFISGLLIFLLSIFISILELDLSVFDLSLDERMSILSSNLGYILQSPIFGQYSAYEPGRYAHNLISVWVDFGVFAFFIFSMAFLLMLFRYLILLSKIRFLTIYRQGLCLYVSTVFLMFTLKDYGYFVFPFSVGIYILVEREYLIYRRKLTSELNYAF